MKKLLSIITVILLLSCDTPNKTVPIYIDTAKKPIDTTSVVNYYVADLWVDCAGVTRKNVIVKSEHLISKEWTRDYLGSGYLKLAGKSADTAYNYKSDGTQNEYCGY